MPELQLRRWQTEALAKALKWLVEERTDRHFLINAAPGSGKTICASVIAKRLIELGEIERVVVIAPRKEVVRQWGEDFKLITGRPMTKVTGADEDISDYGLDVCATWAAIQSLSDAFQEVCRTHKTLVICDEHHHAAVKAAWGANAEGAFNCASFVLILTGTPVRADGRETVWLAFDDQGAIDHPEDGTYTLSYGEAVELGYCRPITFHRHEGRFSVRLSDEENIAVSGSAEPELTPELRRVDGLQRALDYYRLVCTPKYLADGQTPDRNSYQATMLEWGMAKLEDVRDVMPNAGGLVIAPSIGVAEYMADLLEIMDGERPLIVHSQMANAEGRIAGFRNSDRKWLVSVAMISEGVDIKRLRVLIYLPTAKTELAFRQAMGRVVRSASAEDISRGYVVMPTLKTFDEYARRVEQEMAPQARKDNLRQVKVCQVCSAENDKNAAACAECDTAFPSKTPRQRACPDCDALNPVQMDNCQVCGAALRTSFEITLNEALRLGAIVRGMELAEDEVREGEALKDKVTKEVLASGDDVLINILRSVPYESYARFKRILNSEA